MPQRRTIILSLVGTALLALGAAVAVAACSSQPSPAGTASSSAAWTTPADAGLPATPTINTFVIYAQRSVVIGNNSNVWGGNVGVRSTAPTPSGAQLTVDGYAVVENSQSLFAPTASLGINSSVGDLQINSLVQNDNGHYRALTPFPAAAMPPLLLEQPATANTTAVTVAGGAIRTLSPGSYGALTVDSHGKVVLLPGVYSFSSVTMADYGHLVAQPGGVDVRIAGTLNVARYATLQPYCCTGLTASDLTIEVSGNDQPGGVAAATILPHTTIQALLLVPHGTLSLGNTVVAKGAFFGFDVVLGSNVDVNFQSGFLPRTTQGTPIAGYTLPPSSAPILGPVPSDTQIGLAVVLPVNDNAGLQTFIRQVTDPTNSMYRHYMSIATFAAMHGGTPTEYAKVAPWAASFGLTATTYANNLLVDVQGTAAQIEQALSANLLLGQ